MRDRSRISYLKTSPKRHLLGHARQESLQGLRKARMIMLALDAEQGATPGEHRRIRAVPEPESKSTVISRDRTRLLLENVFSDLIACSSEPSRSKIQIAYMKAKRRLEQL
jgi:hypothetical protein